MVRHALGAVCAALAVANLGAGALCAAVGLEGDAGFALGMALIAGAFALAFRADPWRAALRGWCGSRLPRRRGAP